MRHVYENGVTEWFIAESIEQAVELARKNYVNAGITDESEMDLEFTQTPDGQMLEMAEFGPNGETVKQTAAEFAAARDVGFLGTTEY